MNACKLAEQSLNFTQFVINNSLGDLSDADLLVRPVEGANHIAWQIGHLIVAERIPCVLPFRPKNVSDNLQCSTP